MILNMLLLFLIFIAVVSLAFASYMFFHPEKSKLRITYAFIAFTIFSGIMLLMNRPSVMIQTCTTGFVYLGIVFFCTTAARNKLARASNR